MKHVLVFGQLSILMVGSIDAAVAQGRSPAITRETEIRRQRGELGTPEKPGLVERPDIGRANQADRGPVVYGDRYPANNPDLSRMGGGAAAAGAAAAAGFAAQGIAEKILKAASDNANLVGSGTAAMSSIGGVNDGSNKVTPVTKPSKSPETDQGKPDSQSNQKKKDDNPATIPDLSEEGKRRAEEAKKNKS